MHDLGQLFMTGIAGTSLTEKEEAFLRTENIGGVILDRSNFEAPAQLAELINSIQKCRDEYPLLIALDQKTLQEGYLKNYFSQFPSFRELAKFSSPKLIFEIYQVLAKEMKACGVNLCLGPVCDLSSSSDHKVIFSDSFGDDPKEVEKFISASIRGLQTNGVYACPKYFPIHGDLNLMKVPVDELLKREIIPFQKASKARADFMILGHSIVEDIDPEAPLSLSLKGGEFLRSVTRFSKIILTDHLTSKNLLQKFSLPESSLKALYGGADMVLINEVDLVSQALQSLKKEIKTQKISKSHLLEKIKRIKQFKMISFASYSPIYIPQIVDSFRLQETQEIMDFIEKQMKEHSS